MGGGKGGGSAPTETKVTNSSLPEYAQPYYERLMARGEAQSNVPYQPYSGPRLAADPSDILSYYGGVRALNQQGSPLSDMAGQYAAGYTGMAGQAGQYTPGQITASYTPSQWNTQIAQQYMSPYESQVSQVMRDRAILDFQRGQNERNEAAIRSGAFGGYRQGVTDYLAQEGLQRHLSEIDAGNLQASYDRAGQLFNADRADALSGAKFGADVQSQNEAFRQYAANLGLDAARTGLQGSQIMGGLGEVNQNLALQRMQELMRSGAMQEGDIQSQYDIGHQDFVNQRDYPRQQLSFLSGLLHGVPVSPQSEISTYENPNLISQLLGLGVGSAGLYRAFTG